MNRLIWKLLRQHISIGQLTGFFFANLFGLLIVLVGIQFYTDVKPIFSNEGDIFQKKEYVIVTKKISTLGSLTRKSNVFSKEEIADMQKQEFVRQTGAFTPALFKVSAGMGLASSDMNLSTEMFFEAVPDDFVDAKVSKWAYDDDSRTIPIIIPKSYLNLYNFGFAQSRNMPKLSEGLMSLIKINLVLTGNNRVEQYNGIIVGFSNQLNTILVPQQFLDKANADFEPDKEARPSRVILEVKNPTDPAIADYLMDKGYETETGDLDSGKVTYFLRILTSIVMTVGGIICLLSIYILALSIFLLLEKNMQKLQNLLLIGYKPGQIAKPYQLLSVLLNAAVLVISLALLLVVRGLYIHAISSYFPQIGNACLWPSLSIGLGIFLFISLFNTLLIQSKIKAS